jgi:hypothetical protein
MSWKCKFCGSSELKVKRSTAFGDEIELKQDGTYGAVEGFCCQAQKTNALYIKKNFHPDDAPSEDEVSKWE